MQMHNKIEFLNLNYYFYFFLLLFFAVESNRGICLLTSGAYWRARQAASMAIRLTCSVQKADEKLRFELQWMVNEPEGAIDENDSEM